MSGIWIRVEVNAKDKDWTSRLSWNDYGLWLAFMQAMKQDGGRGGLAKAQDIVDLASNRGRQATLEQLQSICAQSEKHWRIEGDEFVIKNWHTYQPDFTGADRQARHREKVKGVTERNEVTATVHDETVEDATEPEALPPPLTQTEELAQRLGNTWVSTGKPYRLKGKAVECAREMLEAGIAYPEIEQAYTVLSKLSAPWDAKKAILQAKQKAKPHVAIENAALKNKQREEAEKLKRELAEQAERENDPEYVRLREAAIAQCKAKLSGVGKL